MKVSVTRANHPDLAHQLAAIGFPLDLRCGGRGTCGRCLVTLLTGRWRVDGQPVDTPCEALACRTVLDGEAGSVEVPEASRAGRNGRVSAEWDREPLPCVAETVIAVDIGTTTLAAVKIRDGRILGKTSCYNPQIRFGDNVITRIRHAAQGELGMLQALATDTIRGMLNELGLDGVARIAVAGNTVMTCLFHGINPESIGALPFTPPLRVFPCRDDLFGAIPVLTVPCISGFVGGDLTAGLSETRLKPGEMLIDIGTNCEIVFATDSGVVCTAAAAGPAFEGAGLSCGCRATDGAIDHYFDNGTFSQIGTAEPIGLCGSGMIDFLAAKHRAGRITMVGRYDPPAVFNAITDEIVVYEHDIEQILKAKGAVWAGIKTIEEHCGRPAEKIYLAGGFAQYINLDNARAIGMLPDRPYQVVGNTSLAGAARLACTPALLPQLEQLIDIPREVPLNTLPTFEDNFIDGLLLP